MPLQRRLPKVGFRSAIAPLVAEVRLNELAQVEGGIIDLAALQEGEPRARRSAERAQDRCCRARSRRRSPSRAWA